MIWGPTVAALSSVYDNCLEKTVVQKAISGFRYVLRSKSKYPVSTIEMYTTRLLARDKMFSF